MSTVTKAEKSLEKIIDLLDDAASKLQLIVEDRDEYAEGKSEDWPETDAGEAYTSITEQLREQLDNITSAKDDLDNITL